MGAFWLPYKIKLWQKKRVVDKTFTVRKNCAMKISLKNGIASSMATHAELEVELCIVSFLILCTTNKYKLYLNHLG